MNLKSIIVAMVIGFALYSCESNEPKYSCDQDVDAWVKDHIEEVQEMTRASWLESDAEVSLAMYRAFTPKQRLTFWNEKFQEVKRLPWSNAEIEHISKAQEYINSHADVFDDVLKNEKNMDQLELFLYEWSEVAKRDFGWTDEVVNAMVASGNRMIDTKGTLSPMKKSNQAGKVLLTEVEYCNCHVSSIFTCSQNISCENSDCTELTWGCGGFLIWSCDGRCEEF